MSALVGALGAATDALVGPTGSIQLGGRGYELDWWIGGDEQWHAGDSRSIRQHFGAAPVVETRMRVAGGEAVASAYGVAGLLEGVVLDVRNDSPAPIMLAVVVRPAASRSRVVVGPRTVHVDDDVIHLPAKARRWATAGSASQLLATISEGRARTDDSAVLSGGEHLVVLHALPHRATIRLGVGPAAGEGANVVDTRTLADPEEVRRGWERALDRGLRVDVPDPGLRDAIDRARATALLRAQRLPRAAGDLFAVLESWGLDDEAAQLWPVLSWRARRRARRQAQRRERVEDAWPAVRHLAARHDSDAAVPLLAAMRSVMLRERGDDVELLPRFPSDWLGQAVAVHDAPTARGAVSFALRWHGDRPALLWDAPSSITLTAPVLDAGWRGSGGSGETLLAAPEPRLIGFGTPKEEASRGGERAAGRPAEPGSFS